MRDTEDRFPTPLSDPAAVGLPDTADDDSTAYDSVLSVREADGRHPAPLPPDREDGPLGLDEYGAAPDGGLRGEALTRRLRREVRESVVRLEPDARLAEEADPDALEQLADDSMALAQDAPVRPNLDSVVSVFDRAVSGVPQLDPVGRLVRPDEGGVGDDESDEVAYDAGASGGGASAEEAAMHLVRPDTAHTEDGGDEAAREDASL